MFKTTTLAIFILLVAGCAPKKNYSSWQEDKNKWSGGSVYTNENSQMDYTGFQTTWGTTKIDITEK